MSGGRGSTVDADGLIDAALLALTQPGWQKVAMILSRLSEARGHPDGEALLHQAAARIMILVESGRLEAQGDLTRWRHSEVRLPASAPGGDYPPETADEAQ